MPHLVVTITAAWTPSWGGDVFVNVLGGSVVYNVHHDEQEFDQSSLYIMSRDEILLLVDHEAVDVDKNMVLMYII